jgi:hypothetical protein
MAQQTKSKSRARSGSRSKTRNSRANGRTATKSGSSASRSQNARTSQRQTRPRASSGRTKASSSNNKEGAVEAAKDATAKGAKTAGSTITSAAKKLKTPMIATGTGLAGVAAGVVLARNKNKRVFGIPLPSRRGSTRATTKSLGDAAKNIGALAERTGKVAEQVRVASEAIDEDSGPRKSKSAIEVVLEGLTSRSQSRAG